MYLLRRFLIIRNYIFDIYHRYIWYALDNDRAINILLDNSIGYGIVHGPITNVCMLIGHIEKAPLYISII